MTRGSDVIDTVAAAASEALRTDSGTPSDSGRRGIDIPDFLLSGADTTATDTLLDRDSRVGGSPLDTMVRGKSGITRINRQKVDLETSVNFTATDTLVL